METEPLLTPRLLLLFLAGCLLFGYPVVDLFSKQSTLAGVPLLFVYLFVAWAAFIAVTAWLVERAQRRER